EVGGHDFRAALNRQQLAVPTLVYPTDEIRGPLAVLLPDLMPGPGQLAQIARMRLVGRVAGDNPVFLEFNVPAGPLGWVAPRRRGDNGRLLRGRARRFAPGARCTDTQRSRSSCSCSCRSPKQFPPTELVGMLWIISHRVPLLGAGKHSRNWPISRRKRSHWPGRRRVYSLLSSSRPSNSSPVHAP